MERWEKEKSLRNEVGKGRGVDGEDFWRILVNWRKSE